MTDSHSLVVPRRSSMPDLSGVFRKNILTLQLANVFNSAGPRTFKARALHIGFVRLVDKSLEEYELARRAFHEYLNPTLGPRAQSNLYVASGHMENCVFSLRRVSRYGEALKRQPLFAESIVGDACSAATHERLRAIRNAAEHMEERILDGRLIEGEIAILFLDEDALRLDGHRIEYEELARWLRELQAIADSVAKIQDTSNVS